MIEESDAGADRVGRFEEVEALYVAGGEGHCQDLVGWVIGCGVVADNGAS